MSVSSSTMSGSSSQDMVDVTPARVPGMQLLQLPDELLDVIVSFIEDVADLRNTASTCSRLNGLAEPFLYQSVVFNDGGQAFKLKTSIERRARRASWVRHLLVSTRFEKAYGIENVPGSLARMHNLQSVHLETPDCNQKKPHERVLWIALQERYERIFQNSSLLMPREERSLPRLQSCMSYFSESTATGPYLPRRLTDCNDRYPTFRRQRNRIVFISHLLGSVPPPNASLTQDILCL